MNINGKHITILGAVRSGIGAAKLAKQLGAIPFVSDFGKIEKIESLDAERINYETGKHSDKVFDCDFIITSPGVPSNSEVLLKAKERNIKVITEVEFASWFCKGTIISITGTNGKTTTTSLMAHLLNSSGYNCYSAGNIGLAFSEVVLKMNENDFVALETSSFQLDCIDAFKPKYSMILNITPDHLDRYNYSVDEYAASKFRVLENQDEDDFYIYNADDKYLVKEISNKKVNKYSFSLNLTLANGSFYHNGDLNFAIAGKSEKVCSADSLKIKGEHNIANALAVLTVAKLIEIENSKIENAFRTFEAVEHRIEFVRELNGVQYFNDSKATNVDAVWYALRSFSEPLYLILGGKDKGNDYNQIKDLVKEKVKKIYAIGVSADKVYEFFKSIVDVEKMSSLESVVEKANKEAVKGDVVLLSPACASFDMFNSYEHRGKVFKEAVNNLK